MRIAPLVLLALGACVGEPKTVGDATARDACGATDYAGLLGTPLAALTLPADLEDRIIRPGDAVTQDFVPTRINFVLDEEGRVARVFCG